MELKQSMFNTPRSPEDKRDFLAKNLLADNPTEELPDSFIVGDVDGYVIHDQGTTSQCVGYAVSAYVGQHYYQEESEYKRFAEGFIYGNRFDSREHLGEGYYIKMAMEDLSEDGCCFHEDFPEVHTYTEAMEAFKNLDEATKEYAKKYRTEFYYRVNHTDPIEVYNLMKKHNTPILVGMMMYKNITQSYNDGIIPNSNGSDTIGGHAVLLKGIKKIGDTHYYVIHNSWGTQYGDNGNFYIPVDNDIIFEMWFAKDFDKTEIKLTIGSSEYTVNGETRTMDTVPVINNDRTYVPLRFVLEALGAEVTWRDTSRTAVVKYAGNFYYFSMSRPEYFGDSFRQKNIHYEDVNRAGLTKHYIDENDRTMIPVRKVFEHIAKCNVSWDEATQTVTIKNF